MLTEYLYRTQEKIPITDGKVTINGESFELSDLVNSHSIQKDLAIFSL
ncbi:hypothetical protein EC604_23185 [Paenibacillus amylolyticus]|uniref:Uncharacterized protein n=1 Tax=Paenibacillus amylolyticus TaxID=1451 RepID=A0A5M9WYL4_PAEAM|nr:hypothetical protein EC604_23185 [Paenibacillus amylolyticus]